MKCTTRNIILCTDCIKNLENVDQYNYWKMAIQEPRYHPDYDDPDLNYLEQNGYIISSEVGFHSILYMPCNAINVIAYDEDKTFPCKFYCANPDEHIEYLHD
jgi:hypothetical protein